MSRGANCEVRFSSPHSYLGTSRRCQRMDPRNPPALQIIPFPQGGVMTIWGFPKRKVPPNHHPFYRWIFPDINHPAVGVPPFWGTPIFTSFRMVFAVKSPAFLGSKFPGLRPSAPATLGKLRAVQGSSRQKKTQCCICMRIWVYHGYICIQLCVYVYIYIYALL